MTTEVLSTSRLGNTLASSAPGRGDPGPRRRPGPGLRDRQPAQPRGAAVRRHAGAGAARPGVGADLHGRARRLARGPGPADRRRRRRAGRVRRGARRPGGDLGTHPPVPGGPGRGRPCPRHAARHGRPRAPGGVRGHRRRQDWAGRADCSAATTTSAPGSRRPVAAGASSWPRSAPAARTPRRSSGAPWEVARRQGARLLELRAAASLFRRRLDAGDARSRRRARDLLAAAVDAMPEGHDTPTCATRPTSWPAPERPNATRNARGTPRRRSWPHTSERRPR